MFMEVWQTIVEENALANTRTSETVFFGGGEGEKDTQKHKHIWDDYNDNGKCLKYSRTNENTPFEPFWASFFEEENYWSFLYFHSNQNKIWFSIYKNISSTFVNELLFFFLTSNDFWPFQMNDIQKDSVWLNINFYFI